MRHIFSIKLALFISVSWMLANASVLESRAQNSNQSVFSDCGYITKLAEVVSGPRDPKELFPNIKNVRNFYDSGKSIKNYFNSVIADQKKDNVKKCVRLYSNFCDKKYCHMIFYYKHKLGFPMNTYFTGGFKLAFDLKRELFVAVKEIEYNGD